MANDGETVKTVTDFIFLGSKITAVGDWSHEIKRHLLLGRIAMTNLDGLLKIRYITLWTKVHIVKAMVFPVVMYRCENWTIKKAEWKRIYAFKLEKTLSSPLDCKEIKPVNPKGNQPWIFTGGTDAELKLKLQYFGHLLQGVNLLEKTLMLGKIEGKRRKGWQRMRWLDGIINSMDMSLGKFWEIVKVRAAWGAAVHGVRHDRPTEQQQKQIISEHSWVN